MAHVSNFRRALTLVIVGTCFVARAHIGSPTVFLEGKAGEYPVRVVIRPPQVIPGLAEITVRAQEPVQRVTVLPVFARAGREGSPPPDEAKLVRGETNLYTASLWLMKLGAYSVDVTIDGPRGKGTLMVPVNAMATNTEPMSRAYAGMLLVLATLLLLGGMRIAGAIIGESLLEPGAVPTRKDRWRGRGAMALTGLVLLLMLSGGKKWWDLEDLNYRNNSLYKPVPVACDVRVEQDQLILNLKVDVSERRGRWTPLIPDHGKLMHLFLVRDWKPGAFAHLHPVSLGAGEFEVPLPPLPAGSYHLYADVTHEDGFSETLIAIAEIPPAFLRMKQLWLGNEDEAICSATVTKRLVENLAFPPDPDDSWQMDRAPVPQFPPEENLSQDDLPLVADAGGGYKMVWENPATRAMDLDASLRFKLLMPDGQPAGIEPYMGMVGHAVVRRRDGAVFAHIHPVGTFSMAAQEYFVSDKSSKGSRRRQRGASNAEPPSSLALPDHYSHTNGAGFAGEVSFPYAFPEPGAYRLWVQMKTQGRILTAVFDANVAATD